MIPPWLAAMRGLAGTAEYPGAADNPVVLGWRGIQRRSRTEILSSSTM